MLKYVLSWISLNLGIKIRKLMRTSTINNLTALGSTFVWGSQHTSTCITVHFLKFASYKLQSRNLLRYQRSACVCSTLSGGDNYYLHH